jgi:hypothetical protein
MVGIGLRWLLPAAAFSVAAVGGAGSAAGAPGGSISFSGSCQLSGTVQFDPPLTAAPQGGDVHATAEGTCNGTFTGAGGRAESTDDMLVRAVAQSAGTESCAAGSGTGTGYLDFEGQLLRFSYSEVRAGPALVLKADGANSGSALVEGNVSPSANPVTILQACGSTGLTDAPIDIRIAALGTISG